MRIAIIGQSVFGAEVYNLLRQSGHEIAGVFTIPDVKGREDPLGKLRENNNNNNTPFYDRDKAWNFERGG